MRTSSSVAALLLLCVIASPALSVTHYITDDGLGDYPTIQAAIDASVSGDTILLADGTFSGAGNWDLDFGGRNIVVKSENGRLMCSIDCGDGASGEHRGFYFHNGEDSTAVVDDISISEGYVYDTEGGGILIENGSNPTIRNCYIHDCRAVYSLGAGGGIAIRNSSPRIIDNLIYANFARQSGGIIINGGSPVIMGNDIYSNTNDVGGGGLRSNSAAPAVVNNWFDSNEGVGMIMENSIIPADDVVIHNNLFTHNTGTGLIWSCDFSHIPSVTSCTFFNNDDGGIWINNGSGFITDCILYGNTGLVHNEIDAPSCTVEYCWVEGGYSGTGNITGTSIAWDYGSAAEPYLPEGNECLDAGSDLAVNICAEMQDGYRCLNQMSALESERPDTGQVDIGYHYIRQRTTLYVPGDADEIQTAIESSVDGDRIEVTGDMLFSYAPIDFLGKAIHVIGMEGGLSPPMIHGGNPPVTFENGETSSSILENIWIRYGSSSLGGGIYIHNASPVIRRCTVSYCSGDTGGGLYSSGGSPLIEDCSFYNNQANAFGGAIYFFLGSPVVRGSYIFNNSADFAGGISCNFGSPLIVSCRLQENTAIGDFSGTRGGGMYSNHSDLTVSYCYFSQNEAQENGGFADGGGLYITADAEICRVDHCSFGGNSALTGAGIFARGGTHVIENSIIAFNWLGEAAACADGGEFEISCTDIYNNDNGDWTGCLAGQDSLRNNFRSDPIFCDLSLNMLNIAFTSPCTESNNPSCGRVGASEGAFSSSSVTLNPGGTGDFATIQDAIDDVGTCGGSTILLENGVYTGSGNVDVSFNGKSMTVKSLSGDPDSCIIDCGGAVGDPHRAFLLDSREGNGARIEGITIRNGWTDAGAAGIAVRNSHPTIVNCVFINCIAMDGGGIQTYQSESVITGCTFLGNWADNAGGGIMNHTSSPVIRDCWFQMNYGEWGGGGIYNHYSAPKIERCTFTSNSSGHWGGGVHNNHPESTPEIRSCTFSENYAPTGGHLYSRNNAAPVLYNTLLVFSFDGEAAYAQTGATTTLYCCDVYLNTGGDYVSALAGQDGMEGNISVDPQFCNQTSRNYRLLETSPCTQPNNGGCGLIGAHWHGCSPTTDVEEPDATPKVTRLFSCYPNPFNPSTSIAFDLSAKGHVSLRIYDAAGRLVRTLVEEDRRAGRFEEIWNGTDNRGGQVASGVYFYRLKTRDFVESKKMILLR